MRKTTKSTERSAQELRLKDYDFNVFFDGACTRRTIPIGSYAFVV